ncbi:UDP-N-acetylglucosamine transporter-like isoform X1 [Dreissena polymorpha]|uniref:UDP-N-acetylglucosamine transporter-like isoform X1 n=1 Tax=Dreissena polymorpha TaxID=45954 RepID=UPI002264E7D9|nr:UDP-N-acetylglucosamine transporter-like isoform X1 [Dreissena polymorpha]
MSSSVTIDHEKERDVRIGIRGTSTDSETVTGNEAEPESASYMLKYISLFALVAQNAMVILVMRFVRTRGGDMFMSTSAVVMSELLKLVSCLLIIFYQLGSVRRFLHHLHENIILQPGDCLKISVPSLVYTLQNNLLYIALSNLDAATFQVSYQLKILTTAIFSVIMLSKALSKVQWMSLVILFVGVSIVQLNPENSQKANSVGQQNRLLGFTAVFISCLMSGFAGVYFEKILKGTKQSLWLRNIQLSVLGFIMGMITMEIKEGDRLRVNGFFYGYDLWVWLVIILQSIGGLLVAIVVKYADNILKGFAASMAIVVSCIVSVFFFDFSLSFQFSFGASLVMLSTYLYGKYVPQASSVKHEDFVNGKVRPV